MPPITPACELESCHASRSSGRSAAKLEKPNIEKMWATSKMSATLFILEDGLAFLEEGGHAFLLVLERELRVEHAPLEARALGERGLVGAIDRFLDHHHDWQRVRGDLRRQDDRLLHQLVERHDTRNLTGSHSLLLSLQ